MNWRMIVLLCWNRNLPPSPSWKCPAHPAKIFQMRRTECFRWWLKSLPDRWSQSERWGRTTWRWRAGTRCQGRWGQTRHWLARTFAWSAPAGWDRAGSQPQGLQSPPLLQPLLQTSLCLPPTTGKKLVQGHWISEINDLLVLCRRPWWRKCQNFFRPASVGWWSAERVGVKLWKATNWMKIKIQKLPVLKGHPWCLGWGGPSGRCTSPPDRSSSPCRWNVNIKNKPVNMCWMLIIHQAAQIVVGRQQIIALLVLHLTAPRLTWTNLYLTFSQQVWNCNLKVLVVRNVTYGCLRLEVTRAYMGLKTPLKDPWRANFIPRNQEGPLHSSSVLVIQKHPNPRWTQARLNVTIFNDNTILSTLPDICGITVDLLALGRLSAALDTDNLQCHQYYQRILTIDCYGHLSSFIDKFINGFV